MNHEFKNIESRNTQRAFTLIELLVVISIISLLSSVVLASLGNAREEGRRAAAQAQLTSLKTAIQLLVNDTGAGPGGCNQGGLEGNHSQELDHPVAGLVSRPAVGQGSGSHGTPCEWSAREVAGWDGPYVTSDELIDPWGDAYRFDSAWLLYQDGSCPNYRGTIQGAIYSFAGTTSQSSGTDDMCDDIWVTLD